MMKKLFALLTMLPLVALADMPGKTIYGGDIHVMSLHRIGYEIFPEFGPGLPLRDRWLAAGQMVSLMHIIIVVASVFIGVMLIVAHRHKLWTRLNSAMYVPHGFKLKMECVVCVVCIAAVGIMILTVFDGTWNAYICVDDRHDQKVKVLHVIDGPVWNQEGDLGEVQAKAHIIKDDLQKAIDALIVRLKLDALRRLDIPFSVSNETFATIVEFPDTLQDNLMRVIVACRNNSDIKYKWGKRPDWEKGRSNHFIIGFHRYERQIRYWHEYFSSKIPQNWLPRNKTSDLDLIRTCLAESEDLRQRCLGIPIEYFDTLNFDVCRGDHNAFARWVIDNMIPNEDKDGEGYK